MVQEYQSPVRVYKYPFEIVMAVSVYVVSWLIHSLLLAIRRVIPLVWKCREPILTGLAEIKCKMFKFINK